MAEIPAPTVEHYRRMLLLQVAGLRAGRSAWRDVSPEWISESWDEQLTRLGPRMADLQVQAATRAASYGADTLATLGDYVPPEGFVNPAGFAGQAPDGRSLRGLLYSPATTAKTAIANGATTTEALAAGGKALDLIVKTVIADTGRQAGHVDMMVRAGVGYVRMISGATCRDCILLAGRWYRWNRGFLRHPGCDCVHVPATVRRLAAADTEGLMDDPYDVFQGMSETDQDKVFGPSNARAIRDGADVYQVVNARRGMAENGLTTQAGLSRTGYAYQIGVRGARLTPEGIYRIAQDRDHALRMLEAQGYLLPGGQTPGGSILGQREGWGALGRGGTRKGAVEDILTARLTGVRDPNVRATMTAAERRYHDAQARWSQVLDGINPFTRDGKGLTPEIAARVENDFRRWVPTRGEVFTR